MGDNEIMAGWWSAVLLLVALGSVCLGSDSPDQMAQEDRHNLEVVERMHEQESREQAEKADAIRHLLAENRPLTTAEAESVEMRPGVDQLRRMMLSPEGPEGAQEREVGS